MDDLLSLTDGSTRAFTRHAAPRAGSPRLVLIHSLVSGSFVRSWPVPPFRIHYQRQPGELVILRVYRQARRPIVR